MSSEETEL